MYRGNNISSYKRIPTNKCRRNERNKKNYRQADTTIVSVAGLVSLMDAKISCECLRRNKIFHSLRVFL